MKDLNLRKQMVKSQILQYLTMIVLLKEMLEVKLIFFHVTTYRSVQKIEISIDTFLIYIIQQQY